MTTNDINTTPVTLPESELMPTQKLSKITKRRDRKAPDVLALVDHQPELPRVLELAAIREGTNYRRTVNADAQGELEASVREHGVLEDITVRPIHGGYEVVFGARRYRAAKAVGIKQLACKVRTLDDTQALELQLVENTQRADVDPLEEAEAFEILHRKMGKSAEEIAAKIGKSIGHVYNRLKLTELSEEGRKAYRDGVLSSYTAMIVARIPHRDLQKRCVAWARDFSRGEETVSARAFADYVKRHFMLDLSKAPFDRRSLELVPAAGTCGDCPKRTGNAKQHDLFGDVTEKDMCTDPKCYQAKVDADAALKLRALAAQGVHILEVKETKKIFGPHGHGDYVSPSTGFIDLDEKRYEGTANGKTLRTLGARMLGAELRVVAALAPSGKVIEMVRVAEVNKAGVLGKTSSTGSASRNTMAAQDAERRKKHALRKEITSLAIANIVEKAEAMTALAVVNKPLWLFLAQAFLENAGSETQLDAARRRDLEGKKNSGANWSPIGAAAPLKKRLPDMTAAELRGLVVDLACGVGAHFGEGVGPHVKAGAEVFRVDLARVTQLVKASKAKKPAPKKLDGNAIKRAAKAAVGKRSAKKGRRS